jgi:ABC-type phosphate/phosphonate transport system substrate-binding protein
MGMLEKKRFWRMSVSAGVWVLLLMLIAEAAFASGRADEQPPIAETKPGEIIRVGFSVKTIANIELQDAKVALKFWSDMQLQEEGSGFTSEVEIFHSVDEILAHLEAKKIDLVVVSAVEFLSLREKIALVPSTCAAYGGSPADVMNLLVHRKSGISSLEGLRKKKLICEVGGAGDIPVLWLETLLMRNGLACKEEYFGMFKTADKPSRAVLPVFFGQVDGGVVRARSFETMASLNPQLKTDLMVIAESAPFFRGLMCYHPDFNPERADRIKAVALKMHTSVKGRQILALFKTEKLLEFRPEFLDSVMALLAENSSLKKEKRK